MTVLGEQVLVFILSYKILCYIVRYMFILKLWVKMYIQNLKTKLFYTFLHTYDTVFKTNAFNVNLFKIRLLIDTYR